MTALAWLLIVLPVALLAYAYLGYPAILRLVARGAPSRSAEPEDWPEVSIAIPAYNEAGSIRDVLDRLLAVDYPADRRQILVVSDASTDGTDEIVRSYAERGVELLRLPERSGKTAAENATAAHVRGDIVVNMDATIRIAPGALRALVAAFSDPTVGVASGRDVSVGDIAREGNQGESGYVGYEMRVRALETLVGSIVGASGCFFAVRRELLRHSVPVELSRDFASPLIAREHGYRSVSVEDAVCFVPRTRSLDAEFRRKVRTMARGIATLWHWRHLMNPVRYGTFAWMLVSHKLCRWLAFAALPLSGVGLVLLRASPWARLLLALAALVLLLGLIGLRWPSGRRVPAPFAVPAFLVGSVCAALLAWARALGGKRDAVWEPTRRPASEPGARG